MTPTQMKTSALAAYVRSRRTTFAGAPIQLAMLFQFAKVPPEAADQETIDETVVAAVAKYFKMSIDDFIYVVAAVSGPQAISMHGVPAVVDALSTEAPPVAVTATAAAMTTTTIVVPEPTSPTEPTPLPPARDSDSDMEFDISDEDQTETESSGESNANG